MREILFRGKTVKGEWCEGLPTRKHPFDKEVNRIQLLDDYLENDFTVLFLAKDVIPETVGQYTGLTDKNGKKIFEGDILKGAWNTNFQVVYDDCYLGFRAKEKDGMHNCIDYYGLDRIEIIGNIHDNPELLKGGAE